MRTSAGRDLQSLVMGSSGGESNTATGVTATTLTRTGAGWTVDAWKGKLVVMGSAVGVILSNTATVLTIDRWNNPNDPGGAAAGTPGAGVYHILQGGAPAWWIAVTENATAPADGDTTLAGELTGFGFQRTLATYAHTAGANNYTLSKTITSSDATARTLQKAAFFNAQNGGFMLFETAIPNPPTLVSGDQTAITDTVSLV